MLPRMENRSHVPGSAMKNTRSRAHAYARQVTFSLPCLPVPPKPLRINDLRALPTRPQPPASLPHGREITVSAHLPDPPCPIAAP